MTQNGLHYLGTDAYLGALLVFFLVGRNEAVPGVD